MQISSQIQRLTKLLFFSRCLVPRDLSYALGDDDDLAGDARPAPERRPVAAGAVAEGQAAAGQEDGQEDPVVRRRRRRRRRRLRRLCRRVPAAPDEEDGVRAWRQNRKSLTLDSTYRYRIFLCK